MKLDRWKMAHISLFHKRMDLRAYISILALLIGCNIPEGATTHSQIKENLYNAVRGKNTTEVVRIVRGQTNEDAKALLDSVMQGNDETLFSIAINNGDIPMIDQLVKLGANPLQKQSLRGVDMTPLEFAKYVRVTSAEICENGGCVRIITWLTNLEKATCNAVECEDNEKCTEGGWGKDATCDCKGGYTRIEGQCKDDNECEDNNGKGPCDHTCTNTPGSYSCSCREGFKQSKWNKNACQDIDECASNSRRGPCDQNCQNTQGSYRCSCVTGYNLMADHQTCMDIDECQSNSGRGDCAQVCTNAPGSYSCSCKEGFKKKYKNDKACHDTDECKNNNGGCDHTCQNFPGNYNCSCRDGYRLKANQKACQETCTVTVCPMNAGCREGTGSMAPTCNCKDGYRSNSTGYNYMSHGFRCQETCTVTECPMKAGCREGTGSIAPICYCKDGYRSNSTGYNYMNNGFRCQEKVLSDESNSIPRNVVIHSLSSSHMIIQWDEPIISTGKITSYKVYYTTKSSEPIQSWKTQQTFEKISTIIKLTPDTIYTIRVQTLTDNGPGPLSDSVNVKTQNGESSIDIMYILAGSIIAIIIFAAIFSVTVWYLKKKRTAGALIDQSQDIELRIIEGNISGNNRQSAPHVYETIDSPNKALQGNVAARSQTQQVQVHPLPGNVAARSPTQQVQVHPLPEGIYTPTHTWGVDTLEPAVFAAPQNWRL